MPPKRSHPDDDGASSLETFRSHVTGLNQQFSSWVARQSTQNPSLLWIEGVRDYIHHAQALLEQHKDALAASGTAKKATTQLAVVQNGGALGSSFPAVTALAGGAGSTDNALALAASAPPTSSSFGGFGAVHQAAGSAAAATGSTLTNFPGASTGSGPEAGKEMELAASKPLFAFGGPSAAASTSFSFGASSTPTTSSSSATAAGNSFVALTNGADAAPASSAAAAASSIFGALGSSSAAPASTSAPSLGFGTFTGSSAASTGASVFGMSTSTRLGGFGTSTGTDTADASAPSTTGFAGFGGAPPLFPFGAGFKPSSEGAEASAPQGAPAFSFGMKPVEQQGAAQTANAPFAFPAAGAMASGFSFGGASTGGFGTSTGGFGTSTGGFGFGGGASGTGGADEDDGADADAEKPVDEFAANTQGVQSDESNEVLAKFRVHAHVGSKVDGALVWNKKGTGNLTLRKAKAAGSKPFVVFGLDNGKVLLTAYVPKTVSLKHNQDSAIIALTTAVTDEGVTSTKSVSFKFGTNDQARKRAAEFMEAIAKAQSDTA